MSSVLLFTLRPAVSDRRRLAPQRRRLRHVPVLVVRILLSRGEMSEGPGIYTHTLYCFSASCRDPPARPPSSIVTTAHAARYPCTHRSHGRLRPSIHVLPVSRLRLLSFPPQTRVSPLRPTTTSIGVSSLLTICGDSLPPENVDRWPNSYHINAVPLFNCRFAK